MTFVGDTQREAQFLTMLEKKCTEKSQEKGGDYSFIASRQEGVLRLKFEELSRADISRVRMIIHNIAPRFNDGDIVLESSKWPDVSIDSSKGKSL